MYKIVTGIIIYNIIYNLYDNLHIIFIEFNEYNNIIVELQIDKASKKLKISTSVGFDNGKIKNKKIFWKKKNKNTCMGDCAFIRNS